MKLGAYKISNLTDARYFSAQGASFMAFEADQLDVHAIGAMKDWLDGVQTTLQITPQMELEEVWSLLDQLKMNHILADFDPKYADWEPYLPELQWTYILTDPKSLSEAAMTDATAFVIPHSMLAILNKKEASGVLARTFLEVNSEFNPGQAALIELGAKGIMLQGGIEEKVGYKSYEALDEILSQYDHFLYQ